MAYDEELAKRIRRVLENERGTGEKKMFGGLAFLIDGNMCCGIVGERLMLRVGPERHERALAKPHVKPMDFTGRPLKGMVYVDPEGLRGANLKRWISWGLEFTRALPAKRSGKSARATRRRPSKTTTRRTEPNTDGKKATRKKTLARIEAVRRKTSKAWKRRSASKA